MVVWLQNNFYIFLIKYIFFSFNKTLKMGGGGWMYIPQLQVPGETSVADASFLNTQATKATKGCNAAATIVLFCTGIHGFKKDSHNMCCHPGTMLNTEDTKLNKSPSCTQNPTIYFAGRNQTHHFVGRNTSLQTAQMKQQFQQEMGFGYHRDGLLVSGFRNS